MKKILLFATAALLACSCYEDYVKDYEYNGVYVAYQYDLRSFIPGEFTDFDFGVVLGGDMENDQTRCVYYSLDDELLTKDLSVYGGDASFTALDGMLGSAKSGDLSQEYVSEAVSAAGLAALTPVPGGYLSFSDVNKIVIDKGRHTGTVKVTASDAFFADPNVGYNPYYAFGYRLTKADADTILLDKSYSVIALRVENTFFGDWYHGGKSVTMDASGVQVSSESYPTAIPCDDATFHKYTLSTVNANSVSTSYFHNVAGTMIIGMDGSNVTISDSEGRITDLGCSWNKAKLLQDRKIFLNYQYGNADGTTTVVTDTLTFRARTRDGVNEWQDENPEHYK